MAALLLHFCADGTKERMIVPCPTESQRVLKTESCDFTGCPMFGGSSHDS